MRARVSRSGFAVPMSMPRYTWAESTLTISNGKRRARSSASSDLPAPVGPISKSALRRPDIVPRNSAPALPGGISARA
jgi:hypothetical protein